MYLSEMLKCCLLYEFTVTESETGKTKSKSKPKHKSENLNTLLVFVNLCC